MENITDEHLMKAHEATVAYWLSHANDDLTMVRNATDLVEEGEIQHPNDFFTDQIKKLSGIDVTISDIPALQERAQELSQKSRDDIDDLLVE